MKFVSLFAGIGGFDLGLERAGMKAVAQCEIEPYPQKILKKHWPDIPLAPDIRKLSYNYKTKQLWYKSRVIYVGSIELVCGGFPCQPFSVAGKQRGKEDNRHLWPEMLRVIREIKPKYVIGENVAGFISMALDDVLSDLEGEGYKCEVFVLPACAVNGIHRRDRVWIIAHSEYDGASSMQKSGCEGSTILNNKKRQNEASEPERVCSSSNVANSKNKRLQRVGPGPEAGRKKESFQGSGSSGSNSAPGYRSIEPPIEPPLRHRDDGFPDEVAMLKALGNAVVPYIPEIFGRAIMEIERDNEFRGSLTSKNNKRKDK